MMYNQVQWTTVHEKNQNDKMIVFYMLQTEFFFKIYIFETSHACSYQK